jgi:raffinose/stachyose/melibiose transport system permease protein
MHIIVFLAPAVLIYTCFFIYPLLNTIRLSFYTPTGSGVELKFAGLQNYVTLLTKGSWATVFWNALKNNLIFFIIAMVVQNTIGLLLAILLNTRILWGRGSYRTLLFAPSMLSVVIVGFIWQLILSPLWGVAKSILSFVHLGALYHPWLGLESSVFITICLISCWQYIGIPMMLFLTALLGIPEEIMEAAIVDGANIWNRFWRIQFPLILPTVGIITILTYTGTLNAFDLMYSLKGIFGDPNYASDVLGLFYYRTFFGSYVIPGNPTMGATIAITMFLIILAGVLFYLVTWQRRIVTVEG